MEASLTKNVDADTNNGKSEPSEKSREDTFNELKITRNQYMKERVHYKMKVYGKLGNRHRWLYYITSFTSIVCAAVVPVLIAQKDDKFKFEATVLSLVVTILVSMEKLFHFRQHWRNYDSIESFLRSEQLYFQTRSGVYAEKDDTDKKEVKDGKDDKDKKDENLQEAFELFVRRIEDAIKNERDQTIEMRTQEISK